MMKKRKRLSAEEKVAILRDHFENDISVADVCEKYRIHPNQFYTWRKELLENAAQVIFSKKSDKKVKKKIDDLESSLKDRNAVIAELLQENINLKKHSGEI
ncbi:transposase [candidate division KSB1 bacterium]|nr:transposase [candidate division KSB1 bacterium]